MPANQSGTILATVVFVLFFCVVAGSQILQHGPNAESRAIELSLAKARAYWAMQGHRAYAMSRAARQNICTATCSDIERRDSLQSYLDELGPLGCTGDDCIRTWTYPEYNNYTLTTVAQAFDLGAAADGHVRLEAELIATGSNRLLTSFEDRIKDLRIDLCFMRNNVFTNPCATQGQTIGTEIDAIGNSVGGTAHITDIRRFVGVKEP